MTRSRTMSRGQKISGDLQGVSRSMVSRAVKDVLSTRIEHKQITASNAYTDFATAGVVTSPLQAIGQGDDINARTGDAIIVERMKLRFTLKASTTVSSASYSARIIVFSDTLNQGAIPAVTDVLASADVSSGFSQTAVQQKRFKIYVDQRFALVGGASNALVVYDRDLELQRRVFYTAASGATSHGKNAIFILFISDAAVLGTNQYKWGHATSYTDA